MNRWGENNNGSLRTGLKNRGGAAVVVTEQNAAGWGAERGDLGPVWNH